MQGSILAKQLSTSKSLGAGQLQQEQTSIYEDLNELVDPVNGISAVQWADIAVSPWQQKFVDNEQACEEMALVAFWDMDKEKDVMICQRFFVVPNPMKRVVKKVDGTELCQVLYVSEHTKDIFFFFKGFEAQPAMNEDLGGG